MKGNDALLSIKNLSISIQTRDSSSLLSSVEDVSFDLYSGEILGLVGESGSGKSLTALSIINLLGENKKVTGGSILFKGTEDLNKKEDLLSLSENQWQTIRGNKISMIFQEPFTALNPLIRIGDQIAETLFLHEEKDKVKNRNLSLQLMNKLKLKDPEKLIKAYPHQLSGGMCQRVMIALAAICRPRLLIADEPTTALDKKTEEQILILLKEINLSLGVSILFISHDLGVIRNLCNRVLVMYSGRILEGGNTEEVFQNPAHEYTKGLLDSIPSGTMKGKDLAAIPGKVPSLEEGRPDGCPFHPRCQKASSLCKGEFSRPRRVSATHYTHCVLHGNAENVVAVNAKEGIE